MIKLNPAFLNETELAFAKHIGLELSADGCSFTAVEGDHLQVAKNGNEIVVRYAKTCERFRGIALLKEGIADGEVKDQPCDMEWLGVMLDCSRNAVMNVEFLKGYVMDLAAMGYNQLQLYTEDTFEIKEYPYFGHLRGRYTKEEIRELDAFAKQYGVELVPAVQTLAHLNAIFHWSVFEKIHDMHDILLCGAEETYEFLDRMIASLRDMYSTDKINIGLDEAHWMGLGQYLDNNGYTPRIDIVLGHLNRVVEILRKYNFKPMAWADMFFKIVSGPEANIMLGVTDFPPEMIARIPEEITLLHWDYWVRRDGYYEEILENVKQMQREVGFAGGFQKWRGFCPTVQHAMKACRQALTAMKTTGIKKTIVTGWGDHGGEASAYMMIPGLAMYAEQFYCGDMSDEAVDNRMKALFGYSLDDFRLFEEVHNTPDVVEHEEIPQSDMNRILLWNDPIMGQYDRHILPGFNAKEHEVAELLKVQMEKDNRLNYLFETIYYLCRVLEMKSEFGVQLRAAYEAKNREALAAIRATIPELVDRVDAMHRVFRKNWRRENKIFGFEVQDIRFGNLRARFVYIGELLDQYLNGELTVIEELEQPSLYMDCREEGSDAALNFAGSNWKTLVSTGVL